MNRYFDASSQCLIARHKVIVFPNGRSPGRSYWSSPSRKDKGIVNWSLTEMRTYRHPEISRTAARKLVKQVP